MKYLITSGCSFSHVQNNSIQTWPYYLSQYLTNYVPIHKGLSSQGNGLISRGIIYEVSQLLETTDPTDILVGIMWSGSDRYDFYYTDISTSTDISTLGRPPTRFIPQAQDSWVLLNHNWKNLLAKTYYKLFHDEIGGIIYTLEHVLRTQWFLEKHKVPYFMSKFTESAFHRGHFENNDLKHLVKLINFETFLPIKTGEFEWCRDNYPNLMSSDGWHPSSEQHLLFTQEIIIPYIRKLGIAV